MAAGGGALARRLFRGAETDMGSVAALRRGLRYYRANLRPWNLRRLQTGRIPQPGLVIHATRDPYIGAALMAATADRFDDLRGFERIVCGHFVQRECVEEFNRVVLDFLEEVTQTRSGT